MSDYRAIGWAPDEATLKGFSAVARAKGGAKVTIEIEVTDAFALGNILRGLERVREDQKADAAVAAAEARRAARREAQQSQRAPAKGLGARSVLLLNYRGDDE